MPALVISLVKWSLVIGGAIFGGKVLLNEAGDTAQRMAPGLVQVGAVSVLAILAWRLAK